MLSTGYRFSRAYYWLPFFPSLASGNIFPAHINGYLCCPRLPLVRCLPARVTDCMFSRPRKDFQLRAWRWLQNLLTALFNNTRTLTFKAQPTNVFFATVNQMFGGSFQLTAIAERAVIKSLGTVQTTKQCSAVVGSWEEPPNI